MQRNSDVLTLGAMLPLSWFKWEKLGRWKEEARRKGIGASVVFHFVETSDHHLSLMLPL